eukprot:TRINITY_DN24967_c0_g1_i1.p1 TRINITY_DN24967_c0_g1~~TRINITY_DN24967_c0_g1_i1.p1  ORF type:complete len:192 (+),score=28.63 TRINITY_DN24967_c0_g1_i1:9-584(+)
MIRRPPRSTQSRSSAASDVYKRQAAFQMSAGMLFKGAISRFYPVQNCDVINPDPKTYNSSEFIGIHLDIFRDALKGMNWSESKDFKFYCVPPFLATTGYWAGDYHSIIVTSNAKATKNFKLSRGLLSSEDSAILFKYRQKSAFFLNVFDSAQWLMVWLISPVTIGIAIFILEDRKDKMLQYIYNMSPCTLR